MWSQIYSMMYIFNLYKYIFADKQILPNAEKSWTSFKKQKHVHVPSHWYHLMWKLFTQFQTLYIPQLILRSSLVYLGVHYQTLSPSPVKHFVWNLLLQQEKFAKTQYVCISAFRSCFILFQNPWVSEFIKIFWWN